MKAFGLLLLLSVSLAALGAERSGRGMLEAPPLTGQQGRWTLDAHLKPRSNPVPDAAAGRFTLDARLGPQASAKNLQTVCGTSDSIFSNGFEGP